MDPSDSLVCAQQLHQDTSQRADMLSPRYEKIVTCMTESGLFITTTHTAAEFSLHTVAVSAESVTVGTESMNSSTHGARVMWRTTVPPECVTSVSVEFRTSSRGPVVVTNSTTNRSQTELIQTGLQHAGIYYINVILTGDIPDSVHATLRSRQEQVCIGGKHLVCTSI